MARVRKFPNSDQVNDKDRDPRPLLIVIHGLISKPGDQEGDKGDNEDSHPAGHVGVNGVEELGAKNNLHGRPAQAAKDVEECVYAIMRVC